MSISFSTPSKLLSELGSLDPGIGEQVVPQVGLPQVDSPLVVLPAETSQELANAINAVEVSDAGALLLLKEIDQPFGSYCRYDIPAELLSISDQAQGNSADVADQWVNYILAAWN